MTEKTCPVSKKAYWLTSLLNLIFPVGVFMIFVQEAPEHLFVDFIVSLILSILIVLPGIVLAILTSFLTDTTTPDQKQHNVRRLFLVLTVIHIIFITLTFTFLILTVADMAIIELIGYNKVQKLKSSSQQEPSQETNVNQYPSDK